MVDLDPLTELVNHRSFQERLKQETSRCLSGGDRMALAVIDVDRFSAFNEQYGHSAGDRALQSIATAIQNCAEDFAVCSRFGGEEFAILLPGGALEAIRGFAERILSEFKEGECPFTVSIGAAEFPASTSKAEGLMLAAEIALARAKQLGGNQVCLFDSVPGADTAADPFQLYASIEDGSFATIQALAAAVDAKDAYTNGHSDRVARYAASLAQLAGCTPEEVDRVFRSGTLHDVGKIGIPDSILKKPGRLDPEECRIMETHPVLGEVIVAKVPQLADLLPGVRHHHERWDGGGYPDGLAGENIPLTARLLALADTFDAMTSDRPYRKGLPFETAIGEIAKGAGTQFDPLLAGFFIELVSNSESKAA
jgi:diguanylate cyclase (GGDEF)-like protein